MAGLIFLWTGGTGPRQLATFYSQEDGGDQLEYVATQDTPHVRYTTSTPQQPTRTEYISIQPRRRS